MHRYLIATLAACGLLFVLAPEARAWGAARCGATYHGAGGGFYHTSSRAAYGPYGEHTSTHTTAYSPSTGLYHSGSGQTSGYGGSAYHSSAGYHNAYGGYGAYGGYHSTYGGAAAYGGAYRGW
jgi:hypothetical protein